ncbi:MAG: hypothetical protein IIY23_01350, partial [Erysipelotrichaceae bacterium]|nr:hypothetical protein [Erysipelotrichaceae bacterium]
NIGKNKLLIDKVYYPEEILEGFDKVTREDVIEAASVIGNMNNYSAAAVTGRDIDLEGLLTDEN